MPHQINVEINVSGEKNSSKHYLIPINPPLHVASLKLKHPFSCLWLYWNERNCTLRLTAAAPFQRSVSDKLTTTCYLLQTHISAVPVYACQSVATSVLQLMICTVEEKPDRGRTRSETGLDANNVVFFFVFFFTSPRCTLPCWRDLTRVLLLTRSVIWGWAPWEVSYPLSNLFDLLSPSASPISAQRLSNAR